MTCSSQPHFFFLIEEKQLQLACGCTYTLLSVFPACTITAEISLVSGTTLALVRSSWLRRVTSITGVRATHRQLEHTIDCRTVSITLAVNRIIFSRKLFGNCQNPNVQQSQKLLQDRRLRFAHSTTPLNWNLKRPYRVFGQCANAPLVVFVDRESTALVD